MLIRRASERSFADEGWLQSYRSFPFTAYRDRNQHGFRALRVLNEERIAPSKGFGSQGHRDLEMFLYVLDGALAHKNSTDKQSTLTHGTVCCLSAGRGVMHTETNASATEPVRYLQFWIAPTETGFGARYRERKFDPVARRGRLQLIASQYGDEDSLSLRQEANVYATELSSGQAVRHEVLAQRHAWLHVARGSVTVNGARLDAGDGCGVNEPCVLEIRGEQDAEALLFDLP